MDLALKIGFPVLGGALPFAVNKLTKKEFTTRTMAAVSTALVAIVTLYQNRVAIRAYAVEKQWLSPSAEAERLDGDSGDMQGVIGKSHPTSVASKRVHWFTATGSTVWQCIRPSAEGNEGKAVWGNNKSKLCAAIALAVSAFVVTKLGVGITIVAAGAFAAATFGAAQVTKHIPYIIKGKFAETPAAVVTALALVNTVFAYAHQFTAVQNYFVPVLSKIAVPVIGSKLPLMGDFGRVAGAVALVFVTINGVTSLYNSGVLACARFKKPDSSARETEGLDLESTNLRDGLNVINNLLARAIVMADGLSVDISSMMAKLAVPSQSQASSGLMSYMPTILGGSSAVSGHASHVLPMRSEITLEAVLHKGGIVEALSKNLDKIEKTASQTSTIPVLAVVVAREPTFMEHWVRLNLVNKLQFITDIVRECLTKLADLPAYNKYVQRSDELVEMMTHITAS